MTMRATTTALVLLLATAAAAHIAPVPNTTCALAIGLTAPQAGVAAIVAPPAAGDLVRGVYAADATPEASHVQLCNADPVTPADKCRATPVPRPFTLGAQTGSITLPSAFSLQMFSSGDLRADAVPVTITVGGTSVVVPFDLSTGLVVVGTAIFPGTPIDAAGNVEIAGSGRSDALPAPLGGEALLLRLGCALGPVPPDLDQFALAPRATKVRGTLTMTKVKLSVVIETEFSLPGDFANEPTILQLGAQDAPLVETIAPTAAGAHGRFASSDGTVTITPLKSRTGFKYRLVVKGALDRQAPYASGDDQLALTSGGLVARRTVSLRAKRHGTRLVVREQ